MKGDIQLGGFWLSVPFHSFRFRKIRLAFLDASSVLFLAETGNLFPLTEFTVV